MRNWSIFKYFKEFLTCHVDCIEFLFWFHYCYCGYWKFFWILWCIISKQERERQEKRKVKERNGLRFTGEQRLSFFTGAHESPVPHRVERRCRERLIVLLSRRKDNFCSLSLSCPVLWWRARDFFFFFSNIRTKCSLSCGCFSWCPVSSFSLAAVLLVTLLVVTLSLSLLSLSCYSSAICVPIYTTLLFLIFDHTINQTTKRKKKQGGQN